MQYCTMIDQVEQGGNPYQSGGEDPQASTQPFTNFEPGGELPLNGWPATLWCKYRAVFESVPYAVLTDQECIDLGDAADAHRRPIRVPPNCTVT